MSHCAVRAVRQRRRIERPLQLLQRPLVVIEEIEPAHLVGAVVRAVARPDAPVVGHHVQPLLVVRRGVDRADVLARRRLAMLADHRLQRHLRLLRPTPRNTGQSAASASPGSGPPGPCPRSGCCSRSGRPPRRPSSPRTRSDRSPCPTGAAPASSPRRADSGKAAACSAAASGVHPPREIRVLVILLQVRLAHHRPAFHRPVMLHRGHRMQLAQPPSTAAPDAKCGAALVRSR